MFRYNRAYGLVCFIFVDAEMSNTQIPPETWSDRLTSAIDPDNLKLYTHTYTVLCWQRSVPLIFVFSGDEAGAGGRGGEHIGTHTAHHTV